MSEGSIDDQVVQAYYQGIEDLANQVLSYLRNVDIVQCWELRELMYSNLNSFQDRPQSTIKVEIEASPLGSQPRKEFTD